ncbi:uncharacterized protein LOC116182948 isoform X1 [Photinus pyralis]|uniref:uncharacterized protein LOC116161537 isoform X1 n=1 Tax=Photinus pyralis TaxID=7054 RepID=UPI00126741E9|nr:uncharacterized protein LOC116161537 isoform X1 [Photinus pyralis]XP_031359373.1 uncharacterized protein LOC116182948 isoform X1 [Photinus pyralis]
MCFELIIEALQLLEWATVLQILKLCGTIASQPWRDGSASGRIVSKVTNGDGSFCKTDTCLISDEILWKQADTEHKCRGSMPLRGASIRTEDARTFFVTSNGDTQTFHLKAASREECQQWITALELAKD